jgi:hypothetical protein
MSLAIQLFSLVLEFDLESDWCEKGLEVGEEVFFGDPSVKVEQEEQLSLHQVDLSQSEAEAFVSLYTCVSGPMFVLGARVVQVLGCEDQGGEEDAMYSASHALGNWWQSSLKSGKVDEGGHQCWNLHRRFVDQGGDEGFERR